MPEPGPGVRLVGRAFHTYAQVFSAGPLAPWLSRPNPVRRSGWEGRLTVTAVRPEAAGVVSLTLAGNALPAWRPGAHLDLVLPSGRVRQYSLCGDPADRDRYRIAVRLIADGNGGSREVHGLRPGDVVGVRGPRNAFRLVDAPEYLFIAGGIGITPILPMVRAAARRGVPWRLAYLGRSRDTLPFLGELAGLGDVQVHCDDEHGFADVARILVPGPDVYVCGPPPLMDATRQLLRAVDPGAALFAERFSGPPVVGGSPFTIELARSGRSVAVGADETALAAVRRVLPGVVYSCRQGFCQACRCRVIDGEVEHRDGGPPHAGSMLICVSRAAGERLVLDL